MSRLVVLVFGMVAVMLGSASMMAAEPLDVLLAQYREHGLPMPPESAKLTFIVVGESEVDGVRQPDDYRLAFVERSEEDRSDKESALIAVWNGCLRDSEDEKRKIKAAAPTLESLRRSQPQWDHCEWDLALAVQCHARGWTELANGLLERSRQRERRFYRPAPSKTDREVLALIAWEYWGHQFSTCREDRIPIVRAMRKLVEGDFELDGKEYRNVIADMEAALAPLTSEPDSLDAAVDGLLDYELSKNGGIWDVASFSLNYGGHDVRSETVNRLKDSGLAAVPTLLKHIHDHRATRAALRVSRGGYTWHLRISDLVAELLNELNPEGFSYDFRRADGRGKELDEAHVLHWWSNTQRLEASEYLLRHAIYENDGEYRTRDNFVNVLALQFPDKFLKLFESERRRVKNPESLFTSLLRSRVPEMEKARRLTEIVQSRDEHESNLAWRAMRNWREQSGESLRGPELVRRLDALPKTPDVPYWRCEAGRLAVAVRRSDDAAAWEALLRVALRVDVGQRLEILESLRTDCVKSSPQAINFLAKFLEDTSARTRQTAPKIEGEPGSPFFGPCAGYDFGQLTVRDLAAMQLGSALKLTGKPSPFWNNNDRWAEFHQQVRDALAAWQAKRAANDDAPNNGQKQIRREC